MNKKNLSFMSLLTLSVALLGGCNGRDKNVSEIVLEVGDKKYTAEQLYNQLLSTGTGANEAFSIVLRLVVESSMETNKNIQNLTVFQDIQNKNPFKSFNIIAKN